MYTIKNLTENKITKDKNGENIRHLEITEAVQFIVILSKINKIQVLYTFVPNKPFGQLLEISPTIFIFLKKHLNQNFKKLIYSLQIKIVINQKKKIEYI